MLVVLNQIPRNNNRVIERSRFTMTQRKLKLTSLRINRYSASFSRKMGLLYLSVIFGQLLWLAPLLMYDDIIVTSFVLKSNTSVGAQETEIFCNMYVAMRLYHYISEFRGIYR